ncbi:MAG: hypothetical protein M1358_18435 [Chloroflexi bacterium]|nr:hypothetical protein [Chloroflexota bacterium]
MAAKALQATENQDDPVLLRIKESVRKLDAVMEGQPRPAFIEQGYSTLLEAMRAQTKGTLLGRARSFMASPGKPLLSRRFAAIGAAVLLVGGVSVPAIAGPGPFVEGLSTVTSVVGRVIGVPGPAKIEPKGAGEVRNATGANRLIGGPGTTSVTGSPTATPESTPGSYQVVFSTPELAPTTSATDQPRPIVSPTLEPTPNIPPSAGPATLDNQDNEHHDSVSSTPSSEPTTSSDQDNEHHDTVSPTPTVPVIPSVQPTSIGDQDGERNETPSPTPSAEPTNTDGQDGEHEETVSPTSTIPPTTWPTTPEPQSTPTPENGDNNEN